MNDLCDDLLAEYAELAALAEPLAPARWEVTTPFYGWTIFDEIAHLWLFDEAGLLAIRDPDAFRRDAAHVGERVARGVRVSTLARERLGAASGPELLSRWRAASGELVRALRALGPRDRLPWYGPPMSARSFATARLMETWAHGQDVYDALRLRRPATPRLRHVAHLGVGTFGWTFANRGQPVPPVSPYVELRAPGGEVWSWSEPSAAECVRGTAEEFCLVVTQRRNLRDTALAVTGEATGRWMAMAQCFAGPPAEGPPPGARVVAY